jgi:hypothetical protein
VRAMKPSAPDSSSEADDRLPSEVVGPSKPRLWKILGPGLITGASDDDPSGIATYSQAGAQYGFRLGWTLLLTYPLMRTVGLQIIKADEESADCCTGVGIVFSFETQLDKRPATAGNGVHIAFAAPDLHTVETFYREALRLAGRDGGPPDSRPAYSGDYYGAFVFDLDGNKIEAVINSW